MGRIRVSHYVRVDGSQDQFRPILKLRDGATDIYYG